MRTKLKLIEGLLLANLVLVMGFSNTAVVQAAVGLPDPLNTNRPAASLPQYNKGVDKSIGEYLCIPSDDNTGVALYDCIERVYRFGIVAGALMLVFSLVWAGYNYIVGGEAGKQKGKTMFIGSITGMLLILSSYVLLRFLNPDLVLYKPIQPPIFTSSGLPTCEAIGYGANCIITSGPNTGQVYQGGGTPGQGGCVNKEQGGCTAKTLAACPGMAKNQALGLRICNQESAGGQYAIMSGTDTCTEVTTNSVVSFSGGLWQINIENSAQDFPECAGVLKHVSPGDHCSVYPPYKPPGSQCKCRFGSGGRSAYDKCVEALKNPEKNTQNACRLFNTKSNAGTEPGIRGWQPWITSYNKCKNVNN